MGDTQGHVFFCGLLHPHWLALQEMFTVSCPSTQRDWSLASAAHGEAVSNTRATSMQPGICLLSREHRELSRHYFLSPRRAWSDGDVLREMVHVPHHGRQRLPGMEETGVGREKTRLHPPNLPPTPNPPHPPAHGPRFLACPPQAFSAKCTVSFKKQSETKPHTNI